MFSKILNLFKCYYTNDIIVIYGINFLGAINGVVVKTKRPEIFKIGQQVTMDDQVYRKVKHVGNNEFKEYSK